MGKDLQIIMGVLALGAILVFLYYYLHKPQDLTPIIPLSWKTIAQQGGTINLPSPMLVRYGNDTGRAPYWAYKVIKTGTCSVSEFGMDPNPNTLKHCQVLLGQ